MKRVPGGRSWTVRSIDLTALSVISIACTTIRQSILIQFFLNLTENNVASKELENRVKTLQRGKSQRRLQGRE